MTKRAEQLNELLRSELARLIREEVYLPGSLITITEVDCAPDLSRAKVFLTVLPESSETGALKVLKRHNSIFTKALCKKLKLFRIPLFFWEIDQREKNARRIDETLEEIRSNR